MARFTVARLMHPYNHIPTPPSPAYLVMDHTGKWPDFYLDAEQMDEIVSMYFEKEKHGKKEESTTEEKETAETNQTKKEKQQ